MGTFKQVHVTPEVATELLRHNVHNRNIRPAWVKKYAKDMTEGRWTRNGETMTIIEHTDGTKRILNGQHRLLAVVQSGIAVDFDIYFAGAEEEEDLIFTTLDGGAKRSFEDTFRGRDKAELGPLAEIPPRIVSDAVKAMIIADVTLPQGQIEAFTISNERRMEIMLEQPDEVEFLCNVKRDYKKALRHHIPVGALAALYKCYQLSPNDAVNFANRLVDGSMIGVGNPIYTLRSELIRGIIPTTTLNAVPYWYQLTSRAWNHYVYDRPVYILRAGKTRIDPVAPPEHGATSNGYAPEDLERDQEEMTIAARGKK